MVIRMHTAHIPGCNLVYRCRPRCVYGRRLRRMRSRPPLYTVAAPAAYTVAASIVYGRGLHCVRSPASTAYATARAACSHPTV